MRPIKLTLCGINSYSSSQTIDFSSLAANGIFGIFGATGSGKSTILDAIVLSLYGTTDRDNLASLINVNLHDAFVDFEFEVEQNGVTKYRVYRTFKSRPSGFKSTAELTDLTNNLNLGDTVDGVNEKILNIIGVGKREFLKCIALPQNEFDKFITDAPADRKRSISKLFNLENFGDKLNEKVKDKINLLNVKKSTLTEQLNLYNNVNEQTQKELSIKLNALQVELGTNLTNADIVKKQLNELNVKLDKTKQYYATKYILSDILNENSKYLRLQAELEFFKENKENIVVYNEIKNKIINKDKVNENKETLTLTLKKVEEKLLKNSAEIKKLTEKLELEKISYNTFNVQLETQKFVNKEREKLNEKLEKLAYDKEYLEGEYLSNLEQAKQYDKLVLASESKCENLKTECDNLNETLNKINNYLMVCDSEDFINKLVEIKTCFNQTNLDEVENYRVYRDVLKALSKINKNISDYTLKLTSATDIINSLGIEKNKIKALNKKLDGELSIKEKKLLEETNRLSDLKNTKLKIEYETQNILKNKNDVKTEILTLTQELKTLNKNANGKLLTDNSSKINELELKINELKSDAVSITEEVNKYQSEIKACNVTTNFLMEEINALNKKLPKNFNPDFVSDNVNESNFTSYAKELNDYLNNKNYYETLLENLTKELEGKLIDENEVNALEQNYNALQLKISDLRTELGIISSELNTNAKILNKNAKAKLELDDVNKNLELVLKLQSLISKNALVDFVAEEYLYLITEYSNKFVNNISSGKFQLTYDSKTSEFLAIDNFNGGVTRSIKSLSGGERFIFSLSLALGISQSIATNNDKTFNFFFIDEGFGNLSDDYLDNVLTCFDRLIRLNLTVGFITHVDRMQDFISNKIVVTKENNVSGSVIKQY